MTDRTSKLLLVLVVSLVIRAGYDFVFATCFSRDLVGWNTVSDALSAGTNPYQVTHLLNWPPVWMQLIFLFQKISLATHLPFNAVVRGFLMLTETLVTLLLYAALVRFTAVRHPVKWILFGVALNPIAIYQVCQHCNFDVLVGFWILLAVYLLLRFQERHEPGFWLLTCLALGIGTLTKTVPLCLAPLLLVSLRKINWTERIVGLALLLVPVTLALSILYVLTPAAVETNVLGYRSTLGGFGFTGLFISFGAQSLAALWPKIFVVLYGAGWLGLSAWLASKDTLDNRRLVLIAVTLLLGIVVLGPGKGLQYVYWFLPLLVLLYGLVAHRARVFLLVLYGVAIVSYTIEYAASYHVYGAFLLDGPFTLNFEQTEALLKLGLKLATNEWETALLLPLWLLYSVLVASGCVQLGRDMRDDLKIKRLQKLNPRQPGN